MVTANFTAYGTYTTDSLYQWDKDQTLTVTGIDTDSAVPEVHFTNIDMGRAVVRQASLSGDAIICEIPNGVLQYPYDVKAYIGVWDGDTFTTLETVIIPIIERNKPEDYTLDVDTDEDYYSFNKLTNQYANAATKQEVANIIAHNQDTSSNTELIDIRTGADGAKYATAGQAVREQISGLASDLINGSRAYRPLLNGMYSAGGAFVPSTTTISTSLIQFVAGATISINAGTFNYNVCMWRDTVSTATKTRYDSTALSGSETITPDYDGYIAITFFMTGSSKSKAITVDDFDGSVVVNNGMISTMQADINALQTATAKHVYEINLFYEKTENELDRITACTFLGFKVLEDGTDITSSIGNFKSFIEEKLEQNTSYNLHNVIKMYSVQNSSSTVTNSNHRELIVAYNNYTTQFTRFYCLNTDVKGFVFFKSGEITASFEPSDDVVLDQLTGKYYGTLVNITLDLTDLAPDLTNIDLVDANHFEDYLTITYTEYKLNASTTEYASVVTYNVTGYGLTRFINNRLPQMITKGKVDIIVEFSRHTGDDTYESIICRGEHITNANRDGIYSNLLKLTPILINAFVSKYLADENKYAGVILVPNYEHMASYNTEIRYKSLVDDELTEGSTNLVTSGTLFDIVGDTELPSIGNGTIKDTINSLYNLIGVDEKTASGEVVTLSDAAPLPFNSLKVGIEAVQDLHGYDHPWVGGAGKNLFNKPNLVMNKAIPSGTTIYGQIFGVTASFKLYGYDEENNEYEVMALSINKNSTTTTRAYTRLEISQSAIGALGNGNLMVSLSNFTQFEPYENICPISGWDEANVTRTGKNVFGGLPMAENIVEVGRNATLDTTNKTVTFTSSLPKDDSYERSISEGYKFKENTIYTFIVTYSNSGNNGSLKFRYTTGNNQEITLANTNGQKTKIAVIMRSDYSLKDIILSFYSASSTVLYYEESGLFEGTITAEDFEPYAGSTYTIDLNGTRYGCTLDVVNGVLTVDRAYVDLGTLNWAIIGRRFLVQIMGAKGSRTDLSVANIACSCYKAVSNDRTYGGTAVGISLNKDNNAYCGIYDPTYEDLATFKSAISGQTLVYELATPQTIQLTPTMVRSLLGTTNLWADSGKIEEVGYYPTVQSLIDALSS